ncbi:MULTISPECIES: hypothetical protein [Streptomyces]|uniref:Uncharacterized protein n=1 Tax=Streptomyces pseudovenezuelae TaxID=67350 RepID=A0A117PR85_9ACTN|nr:MULTISPECIES: hypothetical protein [Streptomyces]KUM87273.1 hypothetical protein AQI94_18160 [Streptomyces pseudovenezuelae]
MTHTGRIGSHVIGVPVILIRSDVLARHRPEIWTAPDGPSADPERERLLAEATILHEIRHFHDALLCPPLYDRFMVEAERNAVAATLIAALSENGERDPEKSLGEEHAELIELHRVNAARLARRNALAYERAAVSGIGPAITLVDLLEASALVTELSFLHAAFDEGAYDHWLSLRSSLPAKYTRIISRFSRTRDSFGEDLQRVSAVLMRCLYRPEPSAAALAEAAGLTEREIDALCDASVIAEQLAETEKRQNYALYTILEPEQHPRRVFTNAVDIAELHGLCRARMPATGFRVDAYHRDVRDFPVPATGFFADADMVTERRLPFVRKADIRAAYGDAFTLYSVKDRQRRATPACGYFPTFGTEPCLDLSRVDLMLGLRFGTQALLGEKVSYNHAMDQAYAALYRRWMD